MNCLEKFTLITRSKISLSYLEDYQNQATVIF